MALNLTAAFNHAHIRLPLRLDRVLRWIVVTPDLHRVHHSVEPDEHGYNLWWDRMLGSYRDQPAAGHAGMAIGLGDYQQEPCGFVAEDGADERTRTADLLITRLGGP